MASQDDINVRIFEKLDLLTSAINDMRIEMVELRTEIRLRKECPEPGACVLLRKQVEKHEEMVQQAKGGWRLLAFAATSGGLLGALISRWLKP
jgi:hypothetical protein